MVVMKIVICLGKREECVMKHERGSQTGCDGACSLHPCIVYLSAVPLVFVFSLFLSSLS